MLKAGSWVTLYHIERFLVVYYRMIMLSELVLAYFRRNVSDFLLLLGLSQLMISFLLFVLRPCFSSCFFFYFSFSSLFSVPFLINT